MESENKAALRWSGLNSFSKVFFNFLTPIILARILGPEVFGLMALALILVGFSQIFVDFGTTEAIIKEKEISPKFLSSLFWFNLFIAFSVYFCILLITPFFSSYLNKEELSLIIPILSTAIFFQVYSLFPTSLFKREKDFLSITKADFLSRLFASLLSILLAIYNFKIASLIALSISQATIYAVLMASFSNWRLSFFFSLLHVRQVLTFTASLFYVKVINNIERQSDRFFIGPIFGDVMLGIYTRGLALQKGLQRFFSGLFNPVFFSILSRQDKRSEIINSYLNALEAFMILMFPLYLVFFFFSENVVLIIFGTGWKDMIEFLPFFSLLFLIRPFQKINQEVIKSKGNVTFLVICFSVLTPLLILIYYFYSKNNGISSFINAYVIISIMLFISSTIYVFNLLEIKPRVFLSLFKNYLMRGIVLLGLAIIISSDNLINFGILFELIIFLIISVISMLIIQILNPSKVQGIMQDLAIDSLKKIRPN